MANANGTVLKTTEAADYLGISVSTLYRMEKRGLIRVTKTPGGQRRFDKTQLDAYRLRSHEFVAPQNPQKYANNVRFESDFVAEGDGELDLELEYDTEIDGTQSKPPDPRNTLNELPGKEWIVETKSVWFQKGLGANHPHARIERLHPAPFSFQDVARLISFFSKSGEKVLDPFGGVGSTTKACALTDRIGISVELSTRWMALAKERIDSEIAPGTALQHEWHTGDARHIVPTFPDSSVDFVVTSPPYWAILKKNGDHKVRSERTGKGLSTQYSDDPNDLGNLSNYDVFLTEVVSVFKDCGRVLRPDRYLALIVSDFRHKSAFISFHSDLIRSLNGCQLGSHHRLVLQGTKVLFQNHKKLYPYGYPYAYVENIHHQYILIFRKVPESKFQRRHAL